MPESNSDCHLHDADFMKHNTNPKVRKTTLLTRVSSFSKIMDNAE